jgi:ABC-type transport system involved in cytochrome c biogenesis permease subunit
MTLGTSLLAAALACLGIACVAGVGRAVLGGPALATAPTSGAPRGPRDAAIGRLGATGLLAGLFLLLAAMALRAVLAGRAPWGNLAEVSQALAAILVGGYLLAARSQPIAGLLPLVAGLAALLCVVAMVLPGDIVPLAPALQAPLLLTVHVGAAIVAYAVAGLAFIAAVGELIQRGAGDRIGFLPAEATARSLAHRAVLVAFPILTAAIVLGSVWANLAWRSYWNNDPKELAAAGTWLVYAAYLHVAGRRDRAGRLAAWLLVLGFAGVLFTYLGASLLFPGQHSYAGV